MLRLGRLDVGRRDSMTASGNHTMKNPLPSADGIDARFAAVLRGDWLPLFPARFREPAARAVIQVVVAAVVLLTIAPLADSKGEAWMEASFARTLGIGQALDPINDLVEQYGALLLTSTTALGVQRLGMQIAKTLGSWLFLPALVALGIAALCGPSGQRSLIGWSRRLFGLALFARLALPAAGWIDSLVADRFLEPSYQQASAAVAETTQKIERAEADDADRPWYERYNPVDAIGDRAQKLYESLAAVGESIVNLAIYFTISTIILPLGTLWLLSRLTGAFFSSRADR